MKALTADEMREVDRLTTERFGIPGSQLMENAGRAAAKALWRVVSERKRVRVGVLCGKGNNGGDGFVVARHLRAQKLPTRVILFGKGKRYAATRRPACRAGSKAAATLTALTGKRVGSGFGVKFPAPM